MSIKLIQQNSLEGKNLQFSGYILQKISRFLIKRWIKHYVLISNGVLYTYPNHNSESHTQMISLDMFCQIEIIPTRKTYPFWICVLKPDSNNLKLSPIKFGAESLSQINLFVSALKENTDLSKNSFNQKLQFNQQILPCNSECRKNSGSLTETISVPLPEISNETLSSITQFSNQSFLSDNKLLSNIDPKNNKELNVYQDIDSIERNQPPNFDPNDDYTDMTDGNSNLKLEDIIFNGTSGEANKIFFKSFQLGAFLVRSRNGEEILTAQCKMNVTKYVLVKSPQNNTISIKGEKISFENLTDLLTYYHSNYLPRQDCRLTIPYKMLQN